MQVRNWKKMLQTSENCNNIQEPTNKQNLENLDSDEKATTETRGENLYFEIRKRSIKFGEFNSLNKAITLSAFSKKDSF